MKIKKIFIGIKTLNDALTEAGEVFEKISASVCCPCSGCRAMCGMKANTSNSTSPLSPVSSSAL